MIKHIAICLAQYIHKKCWGRCQFILNYNTWVWCVCGNYTVTTNTVSPDSASCLTWLTQKSNYGQGLHHYTVLRMWTQNTRINPTIGFTNMTRIQLTELSMTSCLWQKIHCWTKPNLLFIWYGSQLHLALSKIKVHLEGTKDFRILKTFRKMWQQCWRLFWKEVHRSETDAPFNVYIHN